MAGQNEWKDGDYVVKPEIVRGLYYQSEALGLFSMLNSLREVRTRTIMHGGKSVTIDAGNDSPVFEKNLNENNTALFTLRERNKGMPTYGDASVKMGPFAEFMHGRIEARLISSPAFPILGFESADNIKRVINDLISVEKDNMALWMAQEKDYDALRALLMGASRGLFDRENGGKGIQLEGAAQGQYRAPWNTVVAGQQGLTPQNFNATTHNNSLRTLLGGMSNADQFHFSYDTHKIISGLIDKLGLKPVRIGGKTYRAVVVIDPRNIERLREDERLIKKWENATPRADDNPSIYSRDSLILDNVFYRPTEQLRFFRPTPTSAASDNGVVWGAGMDTDPRSENYSNDSPYTMSIVMGAGALLRGRRKGDVKFTTKEGDHGKGKEIALHWDDGWMRRDWYAKDGRQKIANDSSFTVFNYDTGVGVW
jgi:hypothetical protein